MGTVVVDLTVSLDGFIAGPDDGPNLPLDRGGEQLSTWTSAGPESNRVERRITPSDASEVVIVDWMTETGAMISGRRTFAIANGRKGGHPDPIAREQTRVIESKGVTHLRYRVVRPH